MVYEKIDPEQGNFSSRDMNPTEEEIRERVNRTIVEFESE